MGNVGSGGRRRGRWNTPLTRFEVVASEIVLALLPGLLWPLGFPIWRDPGPLVWAVECPWGCPAGSGEDHSARKDVKGHGGGTGDAASADLLFLISAQLSAGCAHNLLLTPRSFRGAAGT